MLALVVLLVVLATLSLQFDARVIGSADVPGHEKAVVELADAPEVLLIIALAFITVVACYKLLNWRKVSLRNSHKVAIFMSIFAIFLSATFVFLAQRTMTGDTERLIIAANNFLQDDFSAFHQGGYLFRYPYQLGLAFWFEAVFYLFGPSQVIVIRLMNAVMVGGAVYLVYKIVLLLSERKRYSANLAMLAVILAALWLPLSLFANFAYGSVAAVCFGLMAIYFWLVFLRSDKWFSWQLVVASLSIMVAILLRSNSLIILVAMLLVGVFQAINSWKIRPILGTIVLILTVSLGSSILVGFYDWRTGGLASANGSGAPKYVWLAMGLQESGSGAGWYNGYPRAAYDGNNFNADKTIAQSKSDIRKSLTNFLNKPQYASQFFTEKVLSQWAEPTHQGVWIASVRGGGDRSKFGLSLFSKNGGGKLERAVYAFSNFYQFLIYLLAMFGILEIWRMERRITTKKEQILNQTVL